MRLPPELLALIKSFLPEPEPYVPPQVLYYSYDYMYTEDWNDTEDVRAYGDY